MHGIAVSVPRDRTHADGRRGLGRDPAREGADRRRGRGARRARQHRSRAAWSPTSASSASARSTSSGCRGARSSRSSSRTPAARRLFRVGDQVELSWRPEYAFLLDHAQDAVGRLADRRRVSRRPMSETVRKKRRVTGYFLLGAGRCSGCVLFFLIPFYSLLAASLFNSGGSDFRGYTMTYQWSNYTDAIKAYWPQIVRSLVYGGIATAPVPGPRLRARLRDRVQGRPLEEPDAGAGDRAVLHQLPGAHAVVEADPVRRRLRGEHAAVPRTSWARTATCSDTPFAVVDGPDLQLPAVHGAAALRQHRQDRPPPDRGRPATSTPTRSSASSR